MFEDLTSLWIIGVEAAECKHDSASAVSIAILRQISQDIVDTLLSLCMYSKRVPLGMNLLTNKGTDVSKQQPNSLTTFL